MDLLPQVLPDLLWEGFDDLNRLFVLESGLNFCGVEQVIINFPLQLSVHVPFFHVVA